MVYILHFDKKFHHAQHYVGCTEDLQRRLKEHLNCRQCGSKIVRAAIKKGIKIELAKVYPEGDRVLEKKIKSMKKTSLICPICQRGIN
ncbi:GIY-YIG nuclease family protein [Bacteroidetes/Chlorobi group bacterium ChocPot_Mid]|nr:MAG: GIY-YIG nuclease family protein [Bacteroidetes/Chlorobi group bacterium ChocPot_Mid]